MNKSSIKEIISIIEKKEYIPQVYISTDSIFITVNNIILILINNNKRIRISRSTNPADCRCQSIVSKEKLVNILNYLPINYIKSNEHL
ncbi:MAG: hypothetical protein EU532_13010 [Promethearchaeota archaeon]|nr:MAG: hypothetical protein EU532_13010 [Candidatus Lokiarchaeota archaeon]